MTVATQPSEFTTAPGAALSCRHKPAIDNSPTMRFRLRTLMIVLGLLPPLAAALWLEPVACAFYGFLLACFMAAAFCAANFKRVMRRAFDLSPRRRDSEYGCPMRVTFLDALWLTVAVAILLVMWRAVRGP